MRRIALFGIGVLLLGGVVVPALGVAGPDLTVDVSAPTHAISPYIYGMNFAEPALAAEIDLPLNRFGGNDTSRYDYSIDTSSKGMDYFFSNIPYRVEDGDEDRPLPDQSNVFRYIRQNQSWGGDTLVTVPMMGWMPKAEAYDCSFDVAVYGAQQQVEPWRDDCGNGKLPNGALITWNDPLDASRVVDEDFVTQYVTDLVAEFGTGASGGVRFYNLDNEPMLWNDTHRDVRQTPLGYDELRDRGFSYGAAVKAIDPTAQLLGPVGFGPTEYYFSSLDWTQPGNWWENPFDRNAHGGKPLAEWYLEEMAAFEDDNGYRLLDYFDEHYYPQANGVSLSNNVDAATAALRLRSTRSLWDPTYLDESWVADTESAHLMLIPRMQAWVDENYPGTKLAITEYNWGALNHINGALAQADVLGIFGREGLDLAALWAPPAANQPGAYAFRLYLNYDGAGSKFGDHSVSALSANQGKVSIYGALRSADGALTLVVINKTGEPQTSTLTISGYDASPAVQVWRYREANLNAIVQQPDALVAGGVLSHTYPANSMTLLVLSPPPDVMSNGSFEVGATGWTTINKSGDKVKCDAADPAKVAWIGECGFQFTGSFGVTTKVKQTLTAIVGATGANAMLIVWSKSKNLTATTQVKVTLKTSVGKQVMKFKVAKGTHDWAPSLDIKTMLGDIVSGKVELIIGPGNGKVFMDNMRLHIGTSARGVLPPPDAPSGFRR